MKMNKMLTISLLGTLVLLASGCMKEVSEMNEMYRPEGTPITFSAATSYENGDGTRTEYSGSFFNTSGTQITDGQINSATTAYERIDWVANDPVTIYYKHPDETSSNSNYQVDGINANAELSDASVSAASGSSMLTWASGSGDHVFTAMYPSRGFDGNNTISFDGTTAGGPIPATQTLRLMNSGNYSGKYLPQMKYAYMLAYKRIASSSADHEVYLPFRPAYTAFNFRLRMPSTGTPATGSSTSYKVKSFTMTTAESGKYLAGTFSVDIAGLFSADGKDRGAALANLSVTGGSQSITTSFIDANHPDGVTLSSSSDLDFTLIALPRNITKVVLTLTYLDPDGVEKTQSVQLGGNGSAPVTFDACKKYIITNSNAGFDEWEYIVEPIADITTYGHDAASGNFEVHSYRVSKADNSIKQIVPWKIQYSLDSGSSWQDLTSVGAVNATLNATFQVNTLTGSGALPAPTTGEARTASVSGQTPGTEDEPGTNPSSAARAKLASTPARGTASAPFDLSRHPFYGTDSHIRNTLTNINSANCYIVSAPGYYMFPCVYGNSIKNGADNKSSYWPAAAGDAVIGDSNLTTLADVNSTYFTYGYAAHYYLPQFYNAWEEPIQSPYIWTDCNITPGDESAIVVWQDTAPNQNDEIIPYSATDITNTTELGIRSETINSKTYMYIWFKIDADRIKPGNIMIALRDGSTIVWSWHIWVTEKNLEPQTSDSYTLPVSTDGSVTETFTVLPFNLGWLDSASGSVVKYKDRPIQYRVVQVDNLTDQNVLSFGYNNGNGREFTFIQLGDAKTITPTVGGNPYYQWGRKDPLIPSTEGGGNRPFSQNPFLPNITPSNGTCVTHSGTRDFHSGIQYPYIYYSNDQTLGWMGGQAHPYFKNSFDWYLNKVDRGPYLESQYQVLIDNRVTDMASRELAGYMGTTPVYQISASGTYYTGPFTQAEATAIIGIDSNTHFALADFSYSNSYSIPEKMADLACPYNLWNNYIYSDQPTETSYTPDPNDRHTRPTNARIFNQNKFKTIYDPCPAGFTVPTKASYIGNSPVEYADVPHPGESTERWKGAAPFPGLTIAPATGDLAGVGVTIDGSILFPYTGARVCYNQGGVVVLTPEYQSSHGYYWTDNPLCMEPQAANTYDINSFFFYQHAYLFLFDSSLNGVQYFTRGSAGSIRPMMEMNPRDLNDNGQ